MRSRDRILASLEAVYREAFQGARERDDGGEMARLDFKFQRDQILLEALLDVRALLAELQAERPAEESSSLLDKAEALRRFTRLR